VLQFRQQVLARLANFQSSSSAQININTVELRLSERLLSETLIIRTRL